MGESSAELHLKCDERLPWLRVAHYAHSSRPLPRCQAVSLDSAHLKKPNARSIGSVKPPGSREECVGARRSARACRNPLQAAWLWVWVPAVPRDVQAMAGAGVRRRRWAP